MSGSKTPPMSLSPTKRQDMMADAEAGPQTQVSARWSEAYQNTRALGGSPGVIGLRDRARQGRVLACVVGELCLGLLDSPS